MIVTEEEREKKVDEQFVNQIATDNLLERIAETIRCRLGGRVRNLQLIINDEGLVIRGCVRTYYAKQLAQHAAMQLTTLPIRANEIEVTSGAEIGHSTKLYV